MAARKSAGARTRADAGVKPAAAGLWEVRLLPFLQRRSLLVALAFIAISSARIVATYQELSLTYDEPGHFACGLEYLSEHVYRLETQHPPLTRAAVAMGPYLTGIRLSPDSKGFPMAYPRDSQGRQTLVSSGHADRVIALARLGNLPFFWLASLVVYAWAKRYFDRGVAVLATCLFTLLPPVLAHAGLATTDMGLCACLTAAFYALLVWAESPTWKSGALLGVAAASAALAKFTSLAFLPCATLLALLGYLAARRPGAGTCWRSPSPTPPASLSRSPSAPSRFGRPTGSLSPGLPLLLQRTGAFGPRKFHGGLRSGLGAALETGRSTVARARRRWRGDQHGGLDYHGCRQWAATLQSRQPVEALRRLEYDRPNYRQKRISRDGLAGNRF